MAKRKRKITTAEKAEKERWLSSNIELIKHRVAVPRAFVCCCGSPFITEAAYKRGGPYRHADTAPYDFPNPGPPCPYCGFPMDTVAICEISWDHVASKYDLVVTVPTLEFDNSPYSTHLSLAANHSRCSCGGPP